MTYRHSLASFLLALTLAAPASAQTSFVARVDSSQEVPANASAAFGVVYGTLDGATLTVSFQHDVANPTAAHVHNAPAGSNGGVQLGFSQAGSPHTQSFVTTAQVRAEFNAEGLYLNVHSSALSAGEIRGQLVNHFAAQVYINEYCADPFSNATGGLDTNLDGVAATVAAQQEDEFVEIVNGSPTTVDIGGWTLSDAFGVRHTFATGTTLPPFGAIVVFGGGDLGVFNATAATGVVADTGSLGLNNGSDTITLADGAAVIDSVGYTSGADGVAVTRDTDGPTAGGVFAPHDSTFFGLTHSPGRFLDGVYFFAAASAPPVCGDGVVDAGETCDDGAQNGTVNSCCSSLCAFEGAGVTCDDGLFCTGADTVCDGSGGCGNGTPPCDDGDACNGAETCDASTGCQAGTPLSCDDGNVCNGSETCSASTGCQTGTPLSCDDGNLCNGAETCDASAGCQAGTPLSCDDGNVCNGAETCDVSAGCEAGTALSCDDGNMCNGTETCDASAGCLAGTPLSCDDGNVCNGAETCDSRSGCQGGAPVDCDDGDACTMDLCVEATGACERANVCDGGVESDAGPALDDGGVGADAGPNAGDDAGPNAGDDAGPNAGDDAGPITSDDGGLGADAGPGADGGGVDAGMEIVVEGCSCRSAGGSSASAPWPLLGVLGLALWRRRRR